MLFKIEHVRRTGLVAILLLLARVESNPGPSPRVSGRNDNIIFGLLKVRSAVRKVASIYALLADQDLDVLALTETWMREGDPAAVLPDVAPPGYTVHHIPQRTGRGGMLAVVHRNSINIKFWKIPPTTIEFESQFMILSTPGKSMDLISIYRPPGPVSGDFLEELADLLDQLTTTDRCFLVCGDFNCPGSDNKTIDPRLSDVLTQYNLSQHVKHSMHEKGNILDLILTSVADNLVSGVSVKSAGISDHLLVTGKLSMRGEN